MTDISHRIYRTGYFPDPYRLEIRTTEGVEYSDHGTFSEALEEWRSRD